MSYKGSLESEMQELTEQRKGLYSQSRKSVGEEKETVKARLSEITEQIVRMSLEGFEVAARITGAGAKNIAILL